MDRKYSWLLWVLAFAVLGNVAGASEARVDAAGGLSLVFQDEVYDVVPFVAGNPAGLALISPQDRLDAAIQYFYENEVSDNFQRHYFGTLGDITGSTIDYKGLILFPTSRWAVQADGDYLYTEGLSAAGLDVSGNNRTRELLRTAYNFGPLALGAELLPSQTSSPLAAQPYGLGTITSGQESDTAWSLDGGLLLCFPADPGPQQDRFEIGGTYDYQLKAPQDAVNLDFLPPGLSTASPINVMATDTTYQIFGPEAYFESPGSLQAAVVTRFIQYALNLQESSPGSSLIPTPLNYESGNGSGVDVTGVFKGSIPLGGGPSLKYGALVSVFSSQSDNFNTDGSPSSTSNGQDLKAVVGAGVEKKGEFTVGLQASIENVTGSELSSSGADLGDTDFLDYTVAVGAERWLEKDWAMRFGLIYENQFNDGGVPYSTFYLPDIDPGARIVDTTVTWGLGLKEKDFYSDLQLSYGQPYRYGGTPNAFALQLGAEWAIGVGFD